ncbi:MAG: glycosyltransferase family 2 protein [Candidatus Magasanikbacteria bacterium]
MSNPILSICIPTYNRANFLKKNLDSIISQFNDRNIKELVEVVISDNASTDDTAMVVKSFQERFDNIKFFENDQNLLFDRNLLNVIEKSSGEYCLTIGDDDALFSGSLATIISKLKSIRADYFILNSWGYDHDLNRPLLSRPNTQLINDVIFNSLADFVRSIKKHRDLIGYFGGMSTQLFLRNIWMNYEHKNDFLDTQSMHTLVLLSAYKNSRFALLAFPAVKTRSDNMRWNAIPGLETTIRRSKATVESVLWIKKQYSLSISGWKIKVYYLTRGYWVAFKEFTKKILLEMGLKKIIDFYRSLK